MSRSTPTKPESPSKLLREALYALWKHNDDGFEEFDLFYNDRMYKLIKQCRKKLEIKNFKK